MFIRLLLLVSVALASEEQRTARFFGTTTTTTTTITSGTVTVTSNFTPKCYATAVGATICQRRKRSGRTIVEEPIVIINNKQVDISEIMPSKPAEVVEELVTATESIPDETFTLVEVVGLPDHCLNGPEGRFLIPSVTFLSTVSATVSATTTVTSTNTATTYSVTFAACLPTDATSYFDQGTC